MIEGEVSREVAEGDRRLEGIVDSAMDAIIAIDEQQKIILFNPAAVEMFGVAQEDALGQSISRFVPERFRAGHGDHIRRFRTTGVTGRRMGALGAISGIRADGEEFPLEASISQADVHGERLATVILRDITDRRANEEARLMLAREVDHRAKNALAVVQALLTLTKAPTKEAFVTAIQGRINALARAHSLLSQNQWKGVDLRQITTDETAAYQRPGQIRMTGPDITLEPNAVQPLSLIIHELATNALKYGALSAAEGHVELHWHIVDENLQIEWAEYGGPPVVKPGTTGFGSTLITTVGAKQLRGQIEIEWRAEGIKLNAVLPSECFRAERLFSASDHIQELPVPGSVRDGQLLVVEDEALVALELVKVLEETGWRVIGPASTLEQAFKLIADGAKPDAAVLDVNLNGEMVYPLADLLKSRGVPFLFCTGYETFDHTDRYQYSPVVRKPCSSALLISELRRIMPSMGRAPYLQPA